MNQSGRTTSSHIYIRMATTDLDFRTVTVHRPDSNPVLYNTEQKLNGGPALQGLEVNVMDLFVSKRPTDK